MTEPYAARDEGDWRIYDAPDEPNQFISVTTVLSCVAKPGLEWWFKNNTAAHCQRVLDAASEFGTRAHNVFEANVGGYGLPVESDQKIHCAEHLKWCNEHIKRGSDENELEKMVYSKKHGFAGRVDFIGPVDGRLEVVDWKTSNRYNITYGWQMAAYRLALKEMDPEKYGDVGMRCVQVTRDTATLKEFKYAHLEFCEQAFLHTLGVFKALHFNKLNKLNWPYLNVD